MPRPSSDNPVDPYKSPATDSPDPEGLEEQSVSQNQRTMTIPLGARGSPPIVPASAAAVLPAVFGRYEVQRALGAGAFGDVYLGHDTQLQRPVAIKVLRSASQPLLGEGARSLQEARKLARMRHPGIVTVYDVGVQEGEVYIVSDFLEGSDLGSWLRENRPSWAEAARMAASVADALAHAHARLVVHRDVKPANIILTTEREPVLVDFGIALGEDEAGSGEKGLVSGTPLYMSPEQAEGAAHRIDGRTDVYSLGVVLYELLTGRVPFRATELLELLRQVRTDEPQPPRQLVSDIPPDLERICLKALAKRQQDRYTTAGDFADDLRRFLSPASDPAADAPPATTPILAGSDTGTPLSVSRSNREAERRQLTVLVCGCDLFESEGYLGLDAEDQARVLGAFEQACEEPVRQYGGTVVQCNEKGLLACFGFPVAYENAARRAARTGQAVLDVMEIIGEQFRIEYKLDLNPWVGIHTGPAIVELKAGVVSLVGEARNVAVQLAEVAVAGQVICTESSYRIFQGRFQCAALGPRKIRGVARPVELYRVEGIAVPGSLLDAVAPAELSPLTGRDQEVGLLKDRWEQAQEGMGQVVLLIGEPGLGKSRLVHTIKEHVLGQMVEGEVDAPVIEWRCSPHFQNTRLYPAIDFYERALGFRLEEPPQGRFDRLLHRLEQYDLVRPETVPLWASLLSLPTPDRFPPLSLSPVRQREETFRTLLEWLHTRAARKPILFIVEDLHWVDASTLEFLGQFLAEGLHDSILTLFTFRPEFKTPWPAVAHQTSLALNRLTRRQVGELMRKKTESNLPEAVVAQIYERTGGVPLFVEEFTKMVQESGMQDKRGASSASGGTLLGREIPTSLQDLMMVRLDRMEGERELAQLAATLGREFSHELLAAVAALDEPTLEGELAKLVQAEILYPKGRPPHCSYIFKHALLEDALYNALVKGKRQQFHRRIAEVLEAQFSQTAETRPELLAHHFTEAGIGDRAIGYWLKAGLRSRDRSAEIEAIGHLTKGLELISTFPESAERDAQELPFLHPLGTANIVSRGYTVPEVGPIFNRARELCARIGEPQTFEIRWGTWAFHVTRGDLRLCMELSSEAMLLAEELNDPGTLMEALFMPGLTLFMRADFAGARACHVRALANYDDRARTKFWASRTGQDSGVTHRCFLAMELWHLGYPDQALQVNSELRDVARAIGHPFSLAYSLGMTGWLYQHCRLGAEAEAAGDEELGMEQSFDYWHTSGLLFKAGGILLQGRVEDALALLPLMRERVYRGIWACALTCYFTIAGEAYTRAFRFDDARRILDEGLTVSEERDERSLEAELYRLKGELHLAESDDSAVAEACFHTAIETARRQQSRAWELRATMSLARLWQRQGRRDEARDALAAIYNTYTEGFATPDLVDAKALLETLS